MDINPTSINNDPYEAPFYVFSLASFKLGMKIPFEPFFVDILNILKISLAQLSCTCWEMMSTLFLCIKGL